MNNDTQTPSSWHLVSLIQDMIQIQFGLFPYNILQILKQYVLQYNEQYFDQNIESEVEISKPDR